MYLFPEKREGALIFSFKKSLAAAANSKNIKVLQLDATFSPISAKEHRPCNASAARANDQQKEIVVHESPRMASEQ
jgi:hypothetical protein